MPLYRTLCTSQNKQSNILSPIRSGAVAVAQCCLFNKISRGAFAVVCDVSESLKLQLNRSFELFVQDCIMHNIWDNDRSAMEVQSLIFLMLIRVIKMNCKLMTMVNRQISLLIFIQSRTASF